MISEEPNNVDPRSLDQSKSCDEDLYPADWRSCNSVDQMDGSKYIGHRRREYQDQRFGSFPMHDDYGDESWADDNPWE
jgi:hypothetical protein